MKKPTKLPRLLNEHQASVIIGLSVAWLRKARWQDNSPPFIKIGRCVRYPDNELIAWVERHELRTGTKKKPKVTTAPSPVT